MSVTDEVIKSSKTLAYSVETVSFEPPTYIVYNPLKYAWKPHEAYLRKYVNAQKKIVFLGMNPGPWGMAQTGVPFGEINLIKNWVGICDHVDQPTIVHQKRPIQGFACKKSEVSGKRLWKLFSNKYGHAKDFFKDHFVANYCPLVFMEQSGKNRTPDKLSVFEKNSLFEICDKHLKDLVQILKPVWVIGVGAFAEQRALHALEGLNVRIGRILHPSPASPASNKDWQGTVTKQLQALGVWGL